MLREKKGKSYSVKILSISQNFWEIAAEVSFVWFLRWLYNHLDISNHMQVKVLKRIIQFVKVKIHPESSTEYQAEAYLLIIHQIEHYNANILCQLILQVMKLSVSKKSFFFCTWGDFVFYFWFMAASSFPGEWRTANILLTLMKFRGQLPGTVRRTCCMV